MPIPQETNIKVTDRYKLTAFYESDYDALLELAKHPDFTYAVMNGVVDGSGNKIPVETSVRQYLNKMLACNASGARATCFFAIRDTRNNDRLVGSCNLRQKDENTPGQAVFGIFVHPDYQNKAEKPREAYNPASPEGQDRKMLLRSIFAMVEYAIEHLGLTSLYATIDPLNIKSQRACSALGLKIPEGYITGKDSGMTDNQGNPRPRLVYTADLNDIRAAFRKFSGFMKSEDPHKILPPEGEQPPLDRSHLIGKYSNFKPGWQPQI